MKVLLGMSGGIDSSLSAFLLKKEGWEVTGVTFQMIDKKNTKDLDDAKAMAETIGIPHFVLDVRKEFQTLIMDYFAGEYFEGRTPNPCAVCNLNIKFKLLAEKADELGIQKIATGHYAKIIETPEGFRLTQSKDEKKTQEYFLGLLPPSSLQRILFPLSDYTKEEIRALAEKEGFSRVSNKSESQEVCFIPDNDYISFIKDYKGQEDQKGDILSLSGKKVGEHSGFFKYTIGQRRGIGVGLGTPHFVVSVDAEKNQVVVGEKTAVEKKQMKVFLQNSFEPLNLSNQYFVKIRYRSKTVPCKIILFENNILTVEAETSFNAPAPGQLAVFYDNQKTIVHAGTILAFFEEKEMK